MISKYLTAFMLFASTCLAGMGIGGFPYPGPGVVVVGDTASCSTTAFYAKAGQDSSNLFVYENDYTYFGGTWNGTAFHLCKVDAILEEWIGNTDSKSYRIEVYSTSGTTLTTMKGYSDTVTGTSILPQGSAGVVSFPFTTSVEVVATDAIVLVEMSKTVDATNFIRAYRTASNDALDFASWKADKTQAGWNTNAEITPSFTLYRYE